MIHTPPITINSIPSVRSTAGGITEEFAGVNTNEHPDAFTGGGAFTASIGTGDTVVLRVQAPAGHQFRIRHRVGASFQRVQVSFQFIAVGNFQGFVPHVAQVNFVGGFGSPPVAAWQQTLIADTGVVLGVDGEYNVVGDFTFTAFEARMTVTGPLADIPRDYASAFTTSDFALGVIAFTPGEVGIAPVFELEPQVGACCVNGVCTVVAAPACTGEFIGPNSACFPAVSGGRVLNACCPADFNGDATRDVSDIFSYLTAWFAGCP